MDIKETKEEEPFLEMLVCVNVPTPSQGKVRFT